MIRRLLPAAFTAFLLLPAFAHAQGSASSEGTEPQTVSGSMMITESNELKSLREIRTRNFRQKMLQFIKVDEQFRAHQTAFRTKRAAYRRTCREDVRRSNRDTKFPTMVRCLRGELAIELEFREKESLWLEAVPGLPSPVRSLGISRLDLLKDAIRAVVSAMESNVYADSEELTEARTNLLSKYREPYAGILQSVRTEMTLTWTQELIQSLDGAQKDFGDALDALAQEKWFAARQCLAGLEARLMTAIQAETPPTATDVRLTASLSEECRKMIVQLPVPAPSSSSSSAR